MRSRRIIFSIFVLIMAVMLVTLVMKPGTAIVTAQGSGPDTGEGLAPSQANLSNEVLNGDGRLQTAQQTSTDQKAQTALSVPVATTLSYYTVLGSQLQPRASTTAFVYDGNGCLHVTSASDLRLTFPVNLPEGSVIKYLTIFYIDTSAASNEIVWLTRYIPGQSTSDLAVVVSSGNAGYGSATSTEITHTYSGSGAQYTIIYGWGTTDGSNQICGVQVEYYAPSLASVFLPAISR